MRASEDLRAFVDGYDADAAVRVALPTAMGERARAMHTMLAAAHAAKREPWATMFIEGHGAHWQAVADYVVAHQSGWHRALTEAAGPAASA